MSETRTKSHPLAILPRVAVIVAILLGGVGLMKFLEANGPKADKEPPPRVIPVVRVIEAQSGSEPMLIKTQGQVEPKRRTQAAAEVMGRVTMVSPKFKTGGEFKQGEIMLEIDSADYVSSLATAEASLADAELVLSQEQARADQARRDWQKLGRGNPSDLVLRKPQIKSAKARIAAAKAAMDKAVRDLDRTKLRAPYACRVEAAYTDLGSYITPGARLADLYSVDAYEVRVPITLEETGYLKASGAVGSVVTSMATIGNAERRWQGKVIRSEGLVDRKTMTMYLIVEITPNTDSDMHRLPPSGLFVRSEIQGEVMDGVMKIPRSALRAGNQLLTVNKEGRLEIVTVTVARTLQKSVLISSGLKEGARVIISPLETPVNGMEVQVEKSESADAEIKM